MVMRAYLGGPQCLPSIEPCFGLRQAHTGPGFAASSSSPAWMRRSPPTLPPPASTSLPVSVRAATALSLQNG